MEKKKILKPILVCICKSKFDLYFFQCFLCPFQVCLSRCYGYENIEEEKILKPGQIGIFTSGSRDYYVPMNLKGN